MKHQIGYLFAEAFRGFRSDKFLSITSVITIGICTSVFAALLLAFFLVRSLGGGGGQDSLVRVFPSPQAEDQASLDGLEARLRRLPGLDSIVFVSKDDALIEFRRDFGEEMIRSLDWNPLPHSFLLYPAEGYRSAAQNRILVDQLKSMPEVEEASANSLYLAWVDKWRLPVQAGSTLLMLLVGGALSLIIHNAVKLNLYSRRILVENMKYCGAGQLFILAPFLLEGLILGIGGSLIGVATLAFLVALAGLVSPTLPGQVDFLGVSAALLGSTALIAGVASARTVRQFLRGAAG
ncbi:MAG TPA: permease-like cell division protein FtsX [Geothrix sp.]|nr:permease-like cell division protein FtsX [Geothrix sp.]